MKMKEIEIDGKKYISKPEADCQACDLNISCRSGGCDYGIVTNWECTKHCIHWELLEQEKPAKESFMNAQKIQAIEQFLKYGEETFNIERAGKHGYHGGYYSGGGWAARCLKSHLEELKAIMKKK